MGVIGKVSAGITMSSGAGGILPFKAKRVYLSERLKIFVLSITKKCISVFFLKHFLRCIALNHIKFYTFNKSFIIFLMM